MTHPGEPPPAFFQHLERRTREARASLRAKGYEPNGFECWPPDDWPRGWWDLRRVRVHGVNSRGEERGVLIDVQSKLFKRPIRRVARAEPIEIRIRCGLAIETAGLDDDLLKALRDAFTYDNPEKAKRKRLGYWNGGVPAKIHNYDEEDGRLVLPRGGTDKVREVLKEAERWPPLIYDDRLELDPVDFELGPEAKPAKLREDQERVVRTILERENCLVRAAPGAGKTECALEAIRRARQPALVIVWTSSLLRQWVDRIRLRWGWPEGEIGIWGGGQHRLGRITIGMQQTLWKTVDEVADRFGFVVMDECFEGGTPILMSDGTLKEISDIKPEDRVAVGGRVIRTFRRWYEGLLIDLNGSGATPNHPMATGRGWVATSEVYDSDVLLYDPLHEHRKELRSLRASDASELHAKDPSEVRLPRIRSEGSLPRLRKDSPSQIKGRSRRRLSRSHLEQRKDRADGPQDRARLPETEGTEKARARGEDQKDLDQSGGQGPIRRGHIAGPAKEVRKPEGEGDVEAEGSPAHQRGPDAPLRGEGLWERPAADRVREGDVGPSEEGGLRPGVRGRDEEEIALPVILQNRPGQPQDHGRGGDRRIEPFAPEEGVGSPKDVLPRVEWLDGAPLPGSVRLRRGRLPLHRRCVLLSGWVYNLETEDGVYVASGALVHNCQRASSRTYREVVSRLPARYRVALSADERRKDRLEPLIYDNFGKAAVEITRKELIEAGSLCEVEIVLVPSEFRFPMVENAPRQERGRVVGQCWGEILDAQALDEDRNSLIARIAGDAVRAGKSTIVFVERTESVPHARILASRIATIQGVPCGVMVGGKDNRDAFDEAKQRLASGKLKCAVGSRAVYQGEDIPRLEVGVIAVPTANNRQLLEQQVGRIRRLFRGKTRGTVFYIFDHHVFPGHLQNLRRWYGQKLVRVLDE